MTLFLYSSSRSSSSSSSPSLLLFFLTSPPTPPEGVCRCITSVLSPPPSPCSLSPSPLPPPLTPLFFFFLFSYSCLSHSLLVTPTLFSQDIFSGYLRLSFFKLRCARGYICSPYINTKKYSTRLRCTRLVTLAIHYIHCLQAFVIFPFIIISFFTPGQLDFDLDRIRFARLPPVLPGFHTCRLTIVTKRSRNLSAVPQQELPTLGGGGKGIRSTALLYKFFFCRVWRTQSLT